MAEERRPLLLSVEERRRLTAAVTAFVDDFIESLADGPASYPELTDAVTELLLTPPSEQPSDIAPLLDRIDTGLRTGFDTAAGSHLSYIPSGGVFAAALGRFIGAATNRWTGGSQAQPGAVALEQSIVNWMRGLFGYGSDSAGVLLSGGSMANLIATIAARTRHGERFEAATVYSSERAHHSVEKAAALAGIRRTNIRSVPVDARLRMDVAELAYQMSSDQAAGLEPMLVVATAGTTDTGAIDSLNDCADAASAAGAWLHVDAAYGGFFILTDRGRSRLDGIDRADSITVDAHKSLLLPYGLGGLLVKDGAALVEANEGRGAYMQDVLDRPAIPHFFTFGPELSRPYRGLDVWLALNYHGVNAFRSELDRMLDMTADAVARLRSIPTVELAVEPELTVVAFRSTKGDAASQEIMEHLNTSNEVHVSSTTVDGRFTVRLAFLNHRTDGRHAECATDLVAEAVTV